MFGITIHEVGGRDGKIELKGFGGAVVALIQKWKLERRGENGSAGPTWTLRAALSYPRPGEPAPLLKNAALKKRITLSLTKQDGTQENIEFEILDDGVLRLEGEQLVIEGVRQWQKPK